MFVSPLLKPTPYSNVDTSSRSGRKIASRKKATWARKDETMEVGSASADAAASAQQARAQAASTDRARESERKAARDSEIERAEVERSETGDGVGDQVDVDA